jgi:hypothetical protein
LELQPVRTSVFAFVFDSSAAYIADWIHDELRLLLGEVGALSLDSGDDELVLEAVLRDGKVEHRHLDRDLGCIVRGWAARS